MYIRMGIDAEGGLLRTLRATGARLALPGAQLYGRIHLNLSVYLYIYDSDEQLLRMGIDVEGGLLRTLRATGTRLALPDAHSCVGAYTRIPIYIHIYLSISIYLSICI